MSTPVADKSFVQRFREAERDLLIRQTKAGCILVLILVPGGVSLDWFVYPDLVWPIFKARILCDLIVLPIYLALFTQWGRRWGGVLSAIWAVTPMLSMCYMIYIADGATSPYYAGLNLIIIGACQLIPYTGLEALAYCSVVIVTYLLSCWFAPHGTFDSSVMFNNLFFLVITAIICITSCHYFSRRRLGDFRLRHELDVRNQQLTELDRLKSQFFANVSHELRTPLTLIVAPVEQLLQRAAELPAKARESLELMHRNGMRLLKLINDLLDIVRLEEGRLTLHRTRMQLDQLVSGLVDSVRGLAEHNQLTVEYQGPNMPVLIDGDEVRLEKVILNLLANAIKFTPPGGRITVTLSADAQESRLSVADSGIGIPKADLPHVFDRFRQVDGSATRKFQGLGLGLALAKELVDEHGGRLEAASELGQGSTFTVVLPVAEQPEAPPERGAPEETAEEPDAMVAMLRGAQQAGLEVPLVEEASTGDGEHCVLVIDDEPDMRRYLVGNLSDEFRVLQAPDGLGGLELARSGKPDLVVLDLMLPGMDGLEICRRIRADEQLADLKVLILTARIDEKTKIEALESGANDFLHKPFSSVELKTRIRNLLAAAVLERNLRTRNRELQETLDQLRTTEAQLIQSEKMNALGSLAAGLLHEINNPLNYILMAVGALQSLNGQLDDDTRDTINDIDEGMKRIRDIVTDLRSFAYPDQAAQQAPFPLIDVIETALRFTASELAGVQVDVDSERIAGIEVVGSRCQITQVLVNLLSNAAAALKQADGTRPPQIKIQAGQARGRVTISVWDNGTGVSKEVQSRVFEPFFTTKDVGQGMGLGLSICHTIVKNHGGRVALESEPGDWTQLSFDLPLISAEN